MYVFEIWLLLAGEVRYQLCTVYEPQALAAVVQALALPEKPSYVEITIKLVSKALIGQGG